MFIPTTQRHTKPISLFSVKSFNGSRVTWSLPSLDACVLH